MKIKKKILLGLLVLIVMPIIILSDVTRTQAAKVKATSIALNVNSKTMMVGDSFMIKVKSVKPANASKAVECSSSDENVVSLKKRDGKDEVWQVTANNPGVATITAISKSNKNVKAVCKIVVKEIEGSYKNVKWSVEEDGLLVVKGTGNMYNPEKRPDWLRYNYMIKSARIEVKGATNLRNLLNGCSNLETVDLSKLDTSNVTNMSAMFYMCGKLASLDMSKFDTSKVTNMSYMFYRCSGLTSLDVSEFDTSNVKNISYMFSKCSKLTNLDVSKFDTSKVVNMSGIFYGCKKLIDLDLSGFNTSNVEFMEYMFAECSDMKSLEVNKFDTSKVTDMGFMFYKCKHLTIIDVSKFNTSKVTDMSYMFYGCESLEKINVSEFNTSKVTDMQFMFCTCQSLQELDLSSFETPKLKNIRYMFSDCMRLEKLDLRNFDISSVESYDTFFCAIDSDLEELVMIVTPKKTSNKANEIYLPGCGEMRLDYWIDGGGKRYVTIPVNASESITLTRVDVSYNEYFHPELLQQNNYSRKSLKEVEAHDKTLF